MEPSKHKWSKMIIKAIGCICELPKYVIHHGTIIKIDKKYYELVEITRFLKNGKRTYKK